jgi:CRP-like cAMP-binding protein
MTQAGDMFLEVAAGQTVFREGDPGSEMYIIESGSIDILRIDRGKTPLATLEAGDFFGEMAVLEDQPRFATAIATQPTRLLKIDRAAFTGVLSSNVEIAVRIMRKLTARLRRAEQRASDAHAAIDGIRGKLAERQAAPAPAIETKMSKVAQQPGAPAINSQVAERLMTPVPPARPAPVPSVPTSSLILELLHLQSKTRFRLDARPEFLVGRPDPVTGTTPEINLGPLDVQRSLSRRHAKVLRDGDRFSVREEVGTLNGTWVNAARTKPGETIEFKAGDTLRFGTVELEVHNA